MEKTLKYALIGCGSIGVYHANAVKELKNGEIVALCDIHTEKIEELKEKCGVEAPIYTDYKEMLEKEEVDVVVITTPDQNHKEPTIYSLEKGCHVMCEKPMALYPEECEAMIKTADKCGKLLMIGQVCRCTPAFVKAKEIVDNGVIGDLFFVESEYAHDYANERVKGVDKWRATPERDPFIGGGCHAVDLLRWIAGDPTETMAYSNHKMLPDWPTNDMTISIMKFPNDVMGKVYVSTGCKRGYTMRTVLYGSKGTIIVDNTSPTFTLFLDNEEGYTFGGKLKGIGEKGIQHLIPVSINNHNVTEEHKQFYDSIVNGTPLIATAREGAKTVAVCRAAIESAETGAPVKVDYSFCE